MKRIRFTRFLVLAFGSLTVLAVVIEATVALGTARENTGELLRDKATTLLDGIEQRVESVLRPVVNVGNAMSRMASGDSELSAPDLAAFAFGTLNALPQLRSMTIHTTDGEGVRFERGGPEGIIGEPVATDGPARALLAEAERQATGWWLAPARLDNEILLAYVSPARLPDGSLLGVLVLEVHGATVSRAIVAASSNQDNEQRTPFILYGRDHVIAHPLFIASGLALPGSSNALPVKTAVGDAVLERVWEEDQMRVLKVEPADGDVVKGVGVGRGERAWVFVFRATTRYTATPWVIGAYLDGRRTRTQLGRIALAAVAGVLVVVVAIIAAVIIGKRSSAPAIRLAHAAALVREERLDEVPHLPGTRLAEFDEASDSFNRMVDGLRERNVIRDLFGKFVPTSVAADLLHSPGGLEPQETDATILFVDLAGFTALTERVTPSVLVSVLNDYFSDLVDIIESGDGVVTQFQGDAILAVFNVPRPVEGHAARAVEAARRILTRVDATRYQGEALQCRIGIATGAVVAGNVGATGRMNYTVHGDAVNLAARLEQLNKRYDTRVLMAASTVDGLEESIGLAPVGEESVRGQTVSVKLFTLADDQDASDSRPASE